MTLKLEPCTGCGRHLLVEKIANLTVKCDPTPLTDVGEIVRLLTSPNPPSLWMAENGRLRGARPGEPGPVREHRCAQEALSRPRSTPPGPGVQPTPHKPPAGQQTPFSGPSAANSSARSADRPLFKTGAGVRCSACGQPLDLADTNACAIIELGATVVDAFHTIACGGESRELPGSARQ